METNLIILSDPRVFPFGTLGTVCTALCGSRFCQAGLSPSPSVWVKAGGWSPMHSTSAEDSTGPSLTDVNAPRAGSPTTHRLHQSPGTDRAPRTSASSPRPLPFPGSNSKGGDT